MCRKHRNMRYHALKTMTKNQKIQLTQLFGGGRKFKHCRLKLGSNTRRPPVAVLPIGMVVAVYLNKPPCLSTSRILPNASRLNIASQLRIHTHTQGMSMNELEHWVGPLWTGIQRGLSAIQVFWDSPWRRHFS